MISNLPEKLLTKDILKLTSGNVDAKRDDALNSKLFISTNKSITRFITGRYSIVVGEKGAGKSTIFRLFKEQKLAFSDLQRQSLSIYIEAGFDLSIYNDFINKYVRGFGKSKNNTQFRYQLIWELFFTYKILSSLYEAQLLSSNLCNVLKDFYKVFTCQESAGILDFLKSLSCTVGVQSSMMNSTSLEPYVRIDATNTSEKKEQKKLEEIKFNLSLYKTEINSILESNNIAVRVFVDKLDDFVTKENYNYQKMFLQSLLVVEDSYFDTAYLNIYIFLRTDLYDRLDLTAIGADKIESRKLEIIWEKKEIWDFLARRILFMYKNCFGISRFTLEINNKNVNLDERECEKNVHRISFIETIINKFRKKYHPLEKRDKDLSEQISKEVIHSLFPDKVYHKTKNGKEALIPFLDFVITHTALGTGYSNPRMILLFLETVINETANYYVSNPDLESVKNDEGQFKLIPELLFLQAYDAYKKKVYTIYQKVDFKKNDYFIKLIKIISKKETISYSDILKKMGIQAQDSSQMQEFNRCLAFFCSLGVLSTKDYIKNHSDRVYDIPILFRNTL